jgi:hypothetical protein
LRSGDTSVTVNWSFYGSTWEAEVFWRINWSETNGILGNSEWEIEGH